MRSKLWVHDGMAGSWYFLTVPESRSAEIKARVGPHEHGFGSVPVAVTIGQTSWRTSIFPDAKSGTFLLPVKKAVRQAEQLSDGQTVTCHLEIRP